MLVIIIAWDLDVSWAGCNTHVRLAGWAGDTFLPPAPWTFVPSEASLMGKGKPVLIGNPTFFSQWLGGIYYLKWNMYSVNTVYKGNCHSCFTNKKAEIIGKKMTSPTIAGKSLAESQLVFTFLEFSWFKTFQSLVVIGTKTRFCVRYRKGMIFDLVLKH